ncbi:MAG: hypothetical protein HKN31_09930, partial [Pricia sp.]|nr:hypothetical protein [Pricia sp.]
MLSLVFIVVFVLCFALAALSVLIGYELVNTYNSNFHRWFWYYLLAFYVFALYGVWGQIGMQTLLVSVQSTREVETLIGLFIPILGFPFLIIAMVMFLKMAFALVDIPERKSSLYLHLGLFLLLALLIGSFYLGNQATQLTAQKGPFYLIILITSIEWMYMLYFTGIVSRNLSNVPTEKRKKIGLFT